jgi:carbon-monoxide dehydrogenase medium subunit
MKPSAFRYVRAASIDECVSLIAEHGEEAKVLAGGQSLVPLMNLRLARPAWLVDVNHIPELSYVSLEGEVLRIGATTRHRELASSETVARACPLLAQAASMIGYPAIRNRGTLGGSIVHADPAAEIPCVVCATDAELVAVGPGGRRTIAARDFFVGYFTTELGPSELLVEVRFPAAGPGEAWEFREFTRKSGDFALAAAAVGVAVADGVTTNARIAVGGLADRPVRASEAEASLIGAEPGEEQIEWAATLVQRQLAADAADHADRAELAGVLAARALRAAGARLEEAP